MRIGLTNYRKYLKYLKLSKNKCIKSGYVGLYSNNKIIIIIRILILIHIVCGRIGIEETKEVQHTIFQYEDITRIINPNGGLSPLRGFIWYTCGFMYNIRMFSCWMDIDYCVWLNNSGKSTPVYEYVRNYDRDKVHDKVAQNEYEKKLIEYHSIIINLFPSTEGYLSIHTDKPDSLFVLLNTCMDRDKYRILASLLLLSEGLSVPLNITRSDDNLKCLVLKDLSKDEVHFCVNLSDVYSNNEPDITRNEVVDIIQFFIDNHTDWFLQDKAVFDDQIPYNVFKSGGFLCTLQFLIQSYIFDYIDSVESTLLFSVTVFDLLREYTLYGINKEFRRQAVDIFNSYFIEFNGYNPSAQYYESIDIASIILNRIKVLPFEHGSYISPITSFKFHNKTVHKLERIIEDFLNLSIKKDNTVYTDIKTREILRNPINNAETVLLCLFCCFAYDQYKQEYTVSHIPNASKELKEFFNKYKYMFDITTEEIHNNWNKVVADLNNPYICYVRPNNNQLDLGLLNILCVITEITGIFKEHMPRINKFIETVKGKGNSWYDSRDSLKLRLYIDELFKTLSINKNIRIDLLSVLLDKSYMKRSDLFVDMDIYYAMDEIQESLCINLHSRRIIITFYKVLPRPLSEQHKVSIKREIIKLNELNPSYMQRLVLHYMDYVSVQYDSLYFDELNHQMSDCLSKSVPHPMNININSILIVQKIQSIKYKLVLIRDILLSYLGMNNINCTGAINLVSNILGSIPLNNKFMQDIFFTTIIHCGTDKEYYSRISMSDTVYPVVEFYHDEISIIINKLLEIRSVYVFVYWLRYLLSIRPWPFLYTLDYILDNITLTSRIMVLDFITDQGRTIKHIKRIINDIRALKVEYPDYDCEETVNTILLSLICINCQCDINISIIQAIYKEINEDMPISLGLNMKNRSGYYKIAIDVFSSLKSTLCKVSEDTSKYDKVLSAFIFKYNIKQEREGINRPIEVNS
ncbi:hypothetical protein NEIRO02_2285 [Nematocida sp. AWRm79]|nr:hypothetical protein NEIRO02_2285 [Nematocida sp. AWRm79]